jgi:hypothetical protein
MIALVAAITLNEHPGTTIVTDSVTSDGLTAFIEGLGGKHLRWAAAGGCSNRRSASWAAPGVAPGHAFDRLAFDRMPLTTASSAATRT